MKLLRLELMMENNDIQVHDADEFAYRAHGIGGTDIAVLCGLSKWKTPYQLWKDKTDQLNGIPREKIENKYMRAGTLLEPIIAMHEAEQTGLIVKPFSEKYYIHPEHDFVLMSPDRALLTPEDWDIYCQNSSDLPKDVIMLQRAKELGLNLGVAELKSAYNIKAFETVPPYYYTQLIWYTGGLSLDWGHLSFLYRGIDFEPNVFEHDAELYGELLQRAEHFWNYNVLGGRVPEPINTLDVKLLYPKETKGRVIEASEGAYNLWQKIRTQKDSIKSLETSLEADEETIRLLMKDAEAMTYGQKILFTYKANKDSEIFNAKKFKEENPDLVSAYMETKPGNRNLLSKK